MLKSIEVVAAVIVRDGSLFATQRGYGDFKDMWEFPGGKMESGETPQDALVREIREELDAEITVGDLIRVVEYDYSAFHLKMHCFLCSLNSDFILKEHESARWLTKKDLRSVNWLPADLSVIETLEKSLI